MEAELTQSLTFLAWTGGGFLIVIGIFTAKLLFDLSRLTVSLGKSAKIVEKELDPIMRNVGEAANTVNAIVQSTNKRVGKVTETYDKIAKVAIEAVKQTSRVSGFVLKELAKGVYTGIKSVLKKKYSS